MPNKSFFSRLLGQRGASRSSQQRETVPTTVAQAASPAVQEYQSRDCINCTQTAFLGSTICGNCGRRLREEVVVPDLLAAAIEAMDRPEEGSKLRKKDEAPPTEVLLAYDDRCRRHRDMKALGSFLGRGHPERPERVGAIMARLQESGVLKRVKRYKGREATREELLAVHDVALVAAVEKATRVAVLAAERDKTTWYGPLDAQLDAMELDSKHIQDVYFCPATAACARLAAGSAAEVARRVAAGAARHGAAIIRPPGHHAESSVAMGFCYYNNAAVAARAAQAAGARRVVIMDWDVHHGNGTQHIFYDDPSVLYMSTHRYDHSCFYPGTGNATETGSGPGQGFTVNVPWNHPAVSDADMLAAFRHVILPLASEFRPDLVIVSAGFDAAEGDPLGGCRLSAAAFSHFAAMLSALAPSVLLLEGGYNLTATAAATEACLRVLLGEPPLPLPEPQERVGTGASASAAAPDPRIAEILGDASEFALKSVCQALQAQSPYWEAARKHLALVESALEEKQRERLQQLEQQERQLKEQHLAREQMTEQLQQLVREQQQRREEGQGHRREQGQGQGQEQVSPFKPAAEEKDPEPQLE